MPANRKLDISVDPSFDFLWEVEPDVEFDPLEKFEEDCRFVGASGARGWQRLANLREELKANDARATAIYRKIANAEATPAKSDGVLAKSAKGARQERTRYPSGRCVVAEIGEDGRVLKTYIEEAEVSL
jgi:hypothetical protein